MKKYLLSGIALGFAAALSASTALADITIAVAGPITGQYAAFGEQLKRGAEMAVADINAAAALTARSSSLKSAMTPAIRSRPWPLPIRWCRKASVHGRPLLFGLVDPGL